MPKRCIAAQDTFPAAGSIRKDEHGKLTYTITSADLDAGGYYRHLESLCFDGNVEIADGLGWVRFRGSLFAARDIHAGHGSGIEAAGGIYAGLSLRAGLGICAGDSITALVGEIRASGVIVAGRAIVARYNIMAGLSIKAQSIHCGLRIFAGLCAWAMPTKAEETICAQEIKGKVAYGKVAALKKKCGKKATK